jgi:hypothetical protein
VAERNNIKVQKPAKIDLVVGKKSSCKVLIKNQPFRALIDSGADVSLLSADVYDKLKLDKQELGPPTVDLTTVTGDNIDVEGCQNISFCLGSQQYNHEFHVVNHIHAKVILGFDFITENSVKVS